MNDHAEKYPRVKFETTEGDLVFELWSDVAPQHVEHFNSLIHSGFYNGLTFHRIIRDFIVQGGCPNGDGTGDPGWRVDAEFNDKPHERGTLSMARVPTDPNSGGSQFFICLNRENCAQLDGQYTVFGHLVKGEDTLTRLTQVALSSPELGLPVDPPQILQAWDFYHGDDFEDDNPAPAYVEDPNDPDALADAEDPNLHGDA